MLKTLQLALFIACLTTMAHAQEDKLLGQRIGLRIGSAVPTGDFNKNRFEDDLPPMAKNGMLAQGSYSRDLTAGIALGGTAGWRWNKFDLASFAKEEDELVLSRSATAWQTGYVLTDLYLQSKIRNFIAYFKGSLGGAYSQSPALQVDTRYGRIARTSDSAVSLAYGLAGGVGVQANQMAFSLEIGSLSTRPAYEVNDASGLRFGYQQGMQTVNVTFGVSYTL